jgi:SAM-dependent methyltransferase
MTTTHLFDAYYFQHGCGAPYERAPAWLNFFNSIADRLVREINPPTTLDAGCALGFLVEALRDRGVEAYGLDISEYAIQKVRDDIRPYCAVGSLTQPLPRRYDLITCIEVLEHMPRAEGEQAIAGLCAASDDILFSSTPFDYKEATHFNVQPPEYWAYRFALEGFIRDVDFDATFLTPWAVRFRRNQEPWPRVVSAYERRLWQLSNENHELRNSAANLRGQLAADSASAPERSASTHPPNSIAQTLSRVLAPPGSRRARWLRGLSQWMRPTSHRPA